MGNHHNGRGPFSRVVAIANPAAGKGRTARRLARVVARLEVDGLEPVVVATAYPGHATELAARAAEEGAHVVVAIGGDGTVRETAAGLVGTDTALGILPLGSGNDFARSLGLPLDVDAACRALFTAVVRAVDVGSDESGLFVTIAGVGFAAQVAQEAARLAMFPGPSGYFAGVFKALAHLAPTRVRVHLDDATVEENAVFVLVQNTPFCGGGQKMAPTARLDDGKLDVVLVSDVGRLELARTFPKVYSGRHVTHPAVGMYRSASVRVESDRPLLKILDGDVVGERPLRAVVRPGALRVLVQPSWGSSPDSPDAAPYFSSLR
jgi:YegS/Rv2252/BmrU family lipid kinase